MSSRDTNPWSDFCDPHWELICPIKWHPGILEISTPSPHQGHFKTILALLPADGEASWSLLPSSVSLLLGGTVQQETTYSCIFKVESQKRTSINTNHSYHQCSSPEAGLNWSNNSIRFSFNQPNRKRWDEKLVHVIKHLPHKIFYFDTITRKVTNLG